MSVLQVIEWPAKVLATKSEDVKDFDHAVAKLVHDMHETMEAASGIGLAANQVSIAKKIITIRIPWNEKSATQEEKNAGIQPWHDKPYTFINPVITKKEGKVSWQEGCLSFPDIYEFIDRAKEVWVTAFDEHGNEFDVHATGLFAVCLQHEIDHINGVVFLDRMSRLKASIVRKKLEKRRQMQPSEIESSDADDGE